MSQRRSACDSKNSKSGIASPEADHLVSKKPHGSRKDKERPSDKYHTQESGHRSSAEWADRDSDGVTEQVASMSQYASSLLPLRDATTASDPSQTRAAFSGRSLGVSRRRARPSSLELSHPAHYDPCDYRSPLTTVSMTSAREERTLGIIPEDSVASVIMVPDIILTPPTDGTGSVEHFFMLAADDELDDEQDIEVRDEMPNNAYIDYVWGGWLGEGEVSDDVDDDDDDESM